MTQDSRYLTEAALDEFIASVPMTAFRVPGIPEMQIVFLAGAGSGVALRVQWDGSAIPDVSQYEHLFAAVVQAGGDAWAELLIDHADVFRRALPLIWRIADRIQLEQMSFAEAVLLTLADFQELLQGAATLSGDLEVGLFGELTVIERLMSSTSPAEAVEAWRGPDRDEHDFDLGNADLEAKATVSERRVHWIGSLSQLERTPDRQLWLLSMQLTTGIFDAPTLSDLIAKLRSQLTGRHVGTFDAKLDSAGWRDEYHSTARRHFRLRSRPLLLAVDADFPALTQARVAAAGMPLSRLREIAYSIDVTGLQEELCPPPAIRTLVSEGGRQ
jgi:hypothetical protein